MTDKIKVTHYARRGRQETAIVYVRGNNEELQEMVCRIYAIDQGYKVLYTTRYLEDVNLCDYLIVTNVSRISRDRTKYIEVLNQLEEKGIQLKSVTNQDNAEESISLAIELFKENKAKLDKKMS